MPKGKKKRASSTRTRILTNKEIKLRLKRNIEKRNHVVQIIARINMKFASSVVQPIVTAYVDVEREKIFHWDYRKGRVMSMALPSVKLALVKHARLGPNYFPEYFDKITGKNYVNHVKYILRRE